MTRYPPVFPLRSAGSLGGADQAGPKRRSGYFYVARHFAVMVVLMYAGMFVLDPLYDLVVGVAGVSDPWGRLPVLSNVIMALNMTMPMALYMRHTRHTWRAIGEMSAAMLLPAALTMGPYLLGTMTAGTMMTLSHATMIPLMAVAMILRFREYTPPQPRQQGTRPRAHQLEEAPHPRMPGESMITIAAPTRHTLPARARQLRLRGRAMDNPHVPRKKHTLTAGGRNCLALDKRMVL